MSKKNYSICKYEYKTEDYNWDEYQNIWNKYQKYKHKGFSVAMKKAFGLVDEYSSDSFNEKLKRPTLIYHSDYKKFKYISRIDKLVGYYVNEKLRINFIMRNGEVVDCRAAEWAAMRIESLIRLFAMLGSRD